MNQIYQGLDEIAAVFNISPRTAQRWINEHGLPAFKRPNGTWVLTNSLIDSWALARSKVYREQYRKQKQCAT